MQSNDPAPRLQPLLTPSLESYPDQKSPSTLKPWSLQAQLWVAFFGGVIPVALMAYLNGRRLRLSRDQLLAIVGCGVVGFLVLLAAGYAMAVLPLPDYLAQSNRGLRLVQRAIALVLYMVLSGIQKPADRVHSYNDGEYASPWKAGLAFVFLAGTLENIVEGIVVAQLRSGGI